jgi:hypothetical protein
MVTSRIRSAGVRIGLFASSVSFLFDSRDGQQLAAFQIQGLPDLRHLKGLPIASWEIRRKDRPSKQMESICRKLSR